MNKIIISILLTLSFIYAGVPLPQKQALQEFYSSTSGANWTDNTRWLSGDPCVNKWKGITCNETGTSVTQILFVNNNLAGTIPSELQYLPDLNLLALANNNLTGVIPPELGNLSKLGGLLIFEEDISGTIPVELGNLSELISLSIFSAHIRGEIPVAIAKDTNLTELMIYSEHLSGSLPSEIGNLVKLKKLR